MQRQKNKKKSNKKYKHLTKIDRFEIEILLERGLKQYEIAKVLKVDKSTISRELKRKKGNGIYDGKVAHHKAQIKRSNSKYCGMKIEKDKFLIEFIEKSLKEKQSPESISGRLKKEFKIQISHTSIYKWIYSSNAQRNAKYLCFKRYQKKKQKRNKIKREAIPGLVSIDKRPLSGVHWEGDLFVSPSKLPHSVSVAMFIEQKSQYIQVHKMENRKAKTMVREVNRFLKKHKVSDITFDRGIENKYHEKFKTNSYFCDPRAPWQKPHVENNIGLLRKWFIPKGTDLSKISQKKLDYYVNILNNKWRKSLNYKSPLEVARENGIILDD